MVFRGICRKAATILVGIVCVQLPALAEQQLLPPDASCSDLTQSLETATQSVDLQSSQLLELSAQIDSVEGILGKLTGLADELASQIEVGRNDEESEHVDGYEGMQNMPAVIAVDPSKTEPATVTRIRHDLEIDIAPEMPIAIEFPVSIRGGFRKKHSRLAFERNNNLLVAFAAREFPDMSPNGESVLVVLEDGSIIPLRFKAVTDISQADSVVQVEK